MKELQKRLDAIGIRYFTAQELTLQRRWHLNET